MNYEKIKKCFENNLKYYDFSDEGASEEYKKMKGIEKYFNYKVATKNLFVNLICVKDPDTESDLLQEIYSLLWKEYIEKDIKMEQKIQGETLNSVQTTFNEMYKLHEKLEHKKQRPQGQKISIKYMYTRYFCGIEKYKEDFSFVNDDFLNFLKTYHTLGNFMPVPVGCNGPRGEGPLQDYWDLTLKCIKNYYDSNKDEKWIKLILGENKEEQINRYKNWLNRFVNWEKFVKANFLEAFVDMKNESKEPRELWKDHFKQWNEGKGIVLPENEEQINEYFKNATEYITSRTDTMIEILEEKIKDISKHIK